MINFFGNSADRWTDYGIEDKENFLFVNSCGYQKFITKNFKVARDNGRIDYQIIYIIKGKGYFKFGDHTMELGEGHIVVYQPNVPQYYNYCFKDSTELYWIHFTGYAAHDILSKLGLLDRQTYYIGKSRECIEIFKKVISELQVKRVIYQYQTSAYLLELISLFARILATLEEGPVVSDDIKKAITLMHSNYSQNHPIGFYAKECNLSLYRFIHKFKAATGISPLEYITRIRINEAKDLLSCSSLNVNEVSSIVGYKNPLYFSRIFKRLTGVAPSIYKNQAIHLLNNTSERAHIQ